jgi:hypothetical protein
MIERIVLVCAFVVFGAVEIQENRKGRKANPSIRSEGEQIEG